ncbi:ABC transporter ATP-binding protein [Tistrella mobilis]
MTAGSLFDLAGVVVQRRSGTAVFEVEIGRITLEQGEVVAVTGPSGCGKSTLLDVLAFILPPLQVAGRFLFRPRRGPLVDVWGLARRRGMDPLTVLRRRHVGYVPQVGGLLPFLDVRRNVMLSPALLGQTDDRQVLALVERLGITPQLAKRPADLSVGERQRVAIARALAHGPDVVIADEPTAALDPANADLVLELFVEEARRNGVTAIIATHDWDRVERMGLRRIHHRMVDAGLDGARAEGAAVRARFDT